jgi:hypothetical protein
MELDCSGVKLLFEKLTLKRLGWNGCYVKGCQMPAHIAMHSKNGTKIKGHEDQRAGVGQATKDRGQSPLKNDYSSTSFNLGLPRLDCPILHPNLLSTF